MGYQDVAFLADWFKVSYQVSISEYVTQGKVEHSSRRPYSSFRAYPKSQPASGSSAHERAQPSKVATASYDFRASDAYRKLSKEDRERLEQVHRDFMMLCDALNRYADRHDGNKPDTLDQLVPDYLADLPTDPFTTAETSRQKDTKPNQASKDGWGYSYRKGSLGNRAWCFSGVGLPEFPYLTAMGNVGLHVCKGEWISGINPAFVKEKK